MSPQTLVGTGVFLVGGVGLVVTMGFPHACRRRGAPRRHVILFHRSLERRLEHVRLSWVSRLSALRGEPGARERLALPQVTELLASPPAGRTSRS